MRSQHLHFSFVFNYYDGVGAFKQIASCVIIRQNHRKQITIFIAVAGVRGLFARHAIANTHTHTHSRRAAHNQNAAIDCARCRGGLEAASRVVRDKNAIGGYCGIF